MHPILEAIFGAFQEPQVIPHPGIAQVETVALPPGWTSARVSDAVAITRHHTLTELTSLERWLTALPKERTVPIEVLLDPATDTVHACVDTTARYSDTLSGKLALTPEMTQVKNALGRALEHRPFYLLLRDLKPVLAGGSEHVEVLLTHVKKLHVVVQGKVTSELDERGVITVSGTDQRKDVSVDIPAEIDLDLPIFRGVTDPTDPMKLLTYRLPLTLTIDDEDPEDVTFALTCPSLDNVMTEARADVIAQLDRVLAAAQIPALVGYGTGTVVVTKRGA